ncbi:MAG: DNA polymerase III subunit beta [Campylobacterales bacterium]|nr:DNA polymerase III subunit beta [Campylobacterales bacterium]
MKIVIAKAILENILIHIQPFLEKKDTSQITSHILIEARQNLLVLKATDYEIGLHVQTTQAHIEEVGNVTANGKKLLDIVRILKENDLTLESQHDILHVHQGSSKFKLPTFQSNEFPKFPSFSETANITIDAQSLVTSLKKITPAADTNNPKFELNGALIDIRNNNINFVATDTRRLALVNIDNSSSRELSIIIPKKAIVEIQKLFFDDISIVYDETYLIIKSQNYNFFTKLINGKFPDYNRIIPKELKHTLKLSKPQIIDSIKQITTISNDMKLTFEANKITFESLTDDNIEAKTTIECDTSFSAPFHIAVNSRYILDFLSQIQSTQFTIGMNEPNQPFVLQDNNFKTIVMPIVI